METLLMRTMIVQHWAGFFFKFSSFVSSSTRFCTLDPRKREGFVLGAPGIVVLRLKTWIKA